MRERDNCQRKDHYPTKAEAEQVKRRMRDHWHGVYVVYRCRACQSGWLIGSVDDCDLASTRNPRRTT